jgi:hypothetical protein
VENIWIKIFMCVGLLVGPTTARANDIGDFLEACGGQEDAGDQAECIITSVIVGSLVLVIASGKIHSIYLNNKYKQKELRPLLHKLQEFKANDYADISDFIFKLIPKSVKAILKTKDGISKLRELARNAKNAVKSLKDGTYRITDQKDAKDLAETLGKIKQKYEAHDLFRNIDHLNKLKELAAEVVEKNESMNLGLEESHIKVLKSTKTHVESLISKSQDFTTSLGALIDNLNDVSEGGSFSLEASDVDAIYSSASEFETFTDKVETEITFIMGILAGVKTTEKSNPKLFSETVATGFGDNTVKVSDGDPMSGDSSGDGSPGEGTPPEPETEPGTRPEQEPIRTGFGQEPILDVPI